MIDHKSRLYIKNIILGSLFDQKMVYYFDYWVIYCEDEIEICDYKLLNIL